MRSLEAGERARAPVNLRLLHGAEAVPGTETNRLVCARPKHAGGCSERRWKLVAMLMRCFGLAVPGDVWAWVAPQPASSLRACGAAVTCWDARRAQHFSASPVSSQAEPAMQQEGEVLCSAAPLHSRFLLPASKAARRVSQNSTGAELPGLYPCRCRGRQAVLLVCGGSCRQVSAGAPGGGGPAG